MEQFFLPSLGWLAVGGWLIAGAVLAIGQAFSQHAGLGRVIYWDWVVWCLVLGPLNRIVGLLPAPVARQTNRFLDFTRRHWQSRGDEHRPDLFAWVRPAFAWLQLIGSAAIIAAIVVGVVVKFGFAWALIACVVVFVIWAGRFDPGPYGENAWFVPLVGIFAAVCVAAGLIVRLAVT